MLFLFQLFYTVTNRSTSMPRNEGRGGKVKLQRERRRDQTLGWDDDTNPRSYRRNATFTFDDRGNRIVPDEDEAEGEGRKARGIHFVSRKVCNLLRPKTLDVSLLDSGIPFDRATTALTQTDGGRATTGKFFARRSLPRGCHSRVLVQMCAYVRTCVRPVPRRRRAHSDTNGERTMLPLVPRLSFSLLDYTACHESRRTDRRGKLARSAPPRTSTPWPAARRGARLSNSRRSVLRHFYVTG